MCPPLLFYNQRLIQMEVEAPPGADYVFVRFGQLVDDTVKFNDIYDTIISLAQNRRSIHFDFARTQRINSQGGRHWLQFLQRITPAFSLEFVFLSEPMVDLAAMWPGILGPAPRVIHAIAIPRTCPKCSHRATEALAPRSIQVVAGSPRLAPVKCPKCGQVMELDVAADYFSAVL